MLAKEGHFSLSHALVTSVTLGAYFTHSIYFPIECAAVEVEMGD